MKIKKTLVYILLISLLLVSVFLVSTLNSNNFSIPDVNAAANSTPSDIFPLNSDYYLGAYYMPKPEALTHQWYELLVNNRAEYASSKFRSPLLGLYAGSDQSAMDWRIKFARESGINFWVFNSYWTQNSKGDIYNGDYNAFINSKFSKKMSFGMMITDLNVPSNDSDQIREEFINDIAKEFKKNYLKKSNYLKFNDKPVVYIYVNRIFGDFFDLTKPKKLKKLFNEFEAKVGQEVFWVYAAPGTSKDEMRYLKEAGYAAYSPYYVVPGITSNWGGDSKAITGVDYSQMLAQALKENQKYYAYAGEIGIKYIPSITTNFDERPRYFIDVPVATRSFSTNMTIDAFGDYAKQIRVTADRFNVNDPNSTVKFKNKPVIGLGAFNEWAEDAQIEPGFSQLSQDDPFAVPKVIMKEFKMDRASNILRFDTYTSLFPKSNQTTIEFSTNGGSPIKDASVWNLGQPDLLKYIYSNVSFSNQGSLNGAYTTYIHESTAPQGQFASNYIDIPANVNLSGYSGIRLPYSASCSVSMCTESMQLVWYASTCSNGEEICSEDSKVTKTGSAFLAPASCVSKDTDQSWGYCDFIFNSNPDWKGKLEFIRVVFFTKYTPVHYAISNVSLIQ